MIKNNKILMKKRNDNQNNSIFNKLKKKTKML